MNSKSKAKKRLLKLLEPGVPGKEYTIADVHAISECLTQMGYSEEWFTGNLMDQWLNRLNEPCAYPTLFTVVQEEMDPRGRSNQGPASLWIAKPEYKLGERSTKLFEEIKEWMRNHPDLKAP